MDPLIIDPEKTTSAQKAITRSGGSGSFNTSPIAGLTSGKKTTSESDYLNNYIMGSQEAAYLSYLSAQQAMAQSALEAERNRNFQERIYNQTSAYNAEQAAINRNWQYSMDAEAIQRRVADLKKAGINPILAYQHINGSVPSGAVASIGTLGGAQGTGYSYQAMQENSSALKLIDFLSEMFDKLITNKLENLVDTPGWKKAANARRNGHKLTLSQAWHMILGR